MKIRLAALGASCLAALLTLPSFAAAQRLEAVFEEGVELYGAGDYEGAVSAWKTVVEAGVEDPDVAANLGNAYARQARYGHAIQWYERSLALRPGDSEVERSLSEVTQALGQAQAEQQGEATLETRPSFARSLVRPFTQDGLGLLVLLLDLLLFGLLVARLRVRAEAGRLGLAIATPLVGLLLAIALSGFSVKADWWISGEPAVFVAASSVLREAPDARATSLRAIPEGGRGRVLDDDDGWAEVRLSNGDTGWVESEAVGRLRATR